VKPTEHRLAFLRAPSIPYLATIMPDRSPQLVSDPGDPSQYLQVRGRVILTIEARKISGTR
jgi:hypothetical protein